MAKQGLETVTEWLRTHGNDPEARLEFTRDGAISLALELVTGNDASNRLRDREGKEWRVRRAHEHHGIEGLKKAATDEFGWDERLEGRGESYSGTNLLVDYAWDIRRPEGRSCPPPLTPEKACESKVKKFGFPTYNAARQAIKKQIGKLERGEAPREMVAWVDMLSGADDWREWLKIPSSDEWRTKIDGRRDR